MKLVLIILGIVAFGLTIWPIALTEWLWHTHPRGFEVNAIGGLMLISMLAGIIVAICGTMAFDNKAASVLGYIGLSLCIAAFLIDGVVVLWFIRAASHLSNYGVN
jgi:predicted MFS family arabinose efflux permease